MRSAADLVAEAAAAVGAGDFVRAAERAAEALEVDPGSREAAELLSVAERVGKASQTLRPFGRRMTVTFLFCDLKDSTEKVRGLELEQQRDMFSAFYDIASQVVERYDGHIVKYLGDGLLIAFGYPNPHEDDARRAVHAALGIRDALHRTRGGHDLVARIGVHTGEVVTDVQRGRDLFGRDIHLAERVQGIAEPGRALMSDATAKRVEGYFQTVELGPKELKGFQEGVHLYEVVASLGVEERLEAASVLTPLVGRESERADLLDLWDRVRQGAGGAVMISGEPGIGKSRLAWFARDLAAFHGAEPLQGNCSPYYASSGFHAIARMLQRRWQLENVADPELRLRALEKELHQSNADVEELVPLLAPILSIPATLQIDEAGSVELYEPPEFDRDLLLQKTIDAVVRWWSSAATVEPLVVLIEDLQWADRSTLQVVERVGETPPLGLLLLTTARPEISESMPEEGSEQWPDHLSVMRLSKLDEEDVEALIDAMPSQVAVTPQRRERIVELSEGVPLFVEELTRSGTDLPATIDELLQSQVEEAGEDRTTISIASAIGTTTNVPLLAAVWVTLLEEEGRAIPSDPLDDAASSLDRLVDKRLMERHGRGTANRYRFRHALIRDATYGPISPAEKQRIHRHIAERLAAGAGGSDPSPAVVALHYELAGDAVQSVAWYGQAAAASFQAGSAAEAIDSVDKALAIVEVWPASEDTALAKLQLKMLRGANYQSLEGYGSRAAYEDFSEAQVLSDGLRARYESAGLVMALNAYRAIRGEREESGMLIAQLDDILKSSPSDGSKFEADVDFNRALHAFFQGHIDASRHLWERSITGFESRPQRLWEGQTPPNDPHVAAYAQLIPVYWLQGEMSKALIARQKALELSKDLAFPHGPFMRAYTLAYGGWARLVAENADLALPEFQEVFEIGNRHGFVMWQAFGALGLTAAQLYLQPSEEPLGMLDFLNGAAEQAETWAYQPYYRTQRARVTAELGDTEQALELFDRALGLSEATKEQHYDAMARVLKARVLLDVGRAKEAGQELETAHALAVDQGAHVYRLRAALDIATRLEDDQRPDGYRDWLASARESITDAETHPESYPEVALAREVLG